LTRRALVIRTVVHFWRTNLAVVLGVATAVSVLAGALLVGDSVRDSLRDIAVGRLGRTDHVLASAGFFRDAVAAEIATRSNVSTTPLIVARGAVTHEPSGRRASNVLVYGVDARFWSFHRQPVRDDVSVSAALAAELGAPAGDVLLVRLQKPSAIPVESLFGRKDDVGRTMRLTIDAVLRREQLGEFALSPQQAEVRAIFVPLSRIQRDLGVGARVNTVLVSGGDSAMPRGALSLEDLGLSVGVVGPPAAVAIESASGVLDSRAEAAVRATATRLGLPIQPVFTYLANTIRHGNRQIPYSLVAAVDLTALVPSIAGSANSEPRAPKPDAIVLNSWAARALQASAEDRVSVDYYVWDAARGLQSRSADFTVRAVVPIAGLAADRKLAPEYPGITSADALADWDPPFPIDLSRVRKEDEEYWHQYRTTPKGFITYERGRDLWSSRYGSMTSVRFQIPDGQQPESVAKAVADDMRASVAPEAVGVTWIHARRLAEESASGTTDFGEYFTYFSFFLVVAALLLAVLFFRLGIEQRLRQIGILRAGGYTIGLVRQLLLTEAVVLAIVGSVAGAAGAVLYARIVMHALRTWWVDAVGTTLLELHVAAAPILAGAAAGVAAAVVCVFLSLRAVGKLSPRTLLTAQAIDTGATADPLRAGRHRLIALVLAIAAIASAAVAFIHRPFQTAAFFSGGTALLVACLFALSSWLRVRDARRVAGRGRWAVARLGFRGAAFRPTRSVLSAALIAAAAFIIVSVDAFRHGDPEVAGDRQSGTGGFVLLAQSELPLVHNPNDAAGRDALLMDRPEAARARFTRFRMHTGQDASCLNLYKPTDPTIIAPEPGFSDSPHFTFSSSLAHSEAERANPWLLLNSRTDDGSIPVIVDGTSLQYVLHAAVGDSFALDIGGERPVTLRFVGALRDSVLQGQLVMSEERFVRLFPAEQGYRFFLIDDADVRVPAEAEALAGALERDLKDVGFDAVVAAERLRMFHRVENTYLSTFQALGGLGLLLGTIGLSAVMFRNVLERRRELALLRAFGYDARSISVMVMAEATLLLAAGLAAGACCAAFAIAPAWFERGGTRPGTGLIVLLVAVAVAGIVSSAAATRAALRGNMLEALRTE
jgi:putative ABC transport system permease protein